MSLGGDLWGNTHADEVCDYERRIEALEAERDQWRRHAEVLVTVILNNPQINPTSVNVRELAAALNACADEVEDDK